MPKRILAHREVDTGRSVIPLGNKESRAIQGGSSAWVNPVGSRLPKHLAEGVPDGLSDARFLNGVDAFPDAKEGVDDLLHCVRPAADLLYSGSYYPEALKVQSASSSGQGASQSADILVLPLRLAARVRAGEDPGSTPDSIPVVRSRCRCCQALEPGIPLECGQVRIFSGPLPRAEGTGPLEEVEGSIHGTGGGRCSRRPCRDTGSRIQGLTGPGLEIQAPVDIARGAIPFTPSSQDHRAVASSLDESRGRLEGSVEEPKRGVELAAIHRQHRPAVEGLGLTRIVTEHVVESPFRLRQRFSRVN